MSSVKSNTAAQRTAPNARRGPPKPVSVAAVVVTYNRLALLQESVASLRRQTRRPDEIIVVNNGSTDGTADWLAVQADLTVIAQANLGSSGGQYAGIKTAYHKGHDWFWCMDDDTIPDPDCLELMTAAPYFRPGTGFLCSTLLWSDRQAHPMHAMHPTAAVDWCCSVLEDKCIRVALHTFVSVMVSRAAVSTVGLPVKEFFLIVDDYEYTDRISQRFPSYCVLDSRVVHKTRRRGDGTQDLWGADLLKECYRARNEVAWTLRRANLGRWGKLVYIATLGAFYTRMVLKRAAHPRLLWWLFRGLFFRYRVDPA